jgi:hypothetical protein
MKVKDRELEYSGAPFGRPKSPLFSKSWRIQHGILIPKDLFAAAQPVLYGQDSIAVTSMQSGLAVYCGYEAGAPGYASGGYTTMGSVYAVWPGRKYLSVGRDCIDIEPGLASPGDGPGFVRNAAPPHTTKPVVYCSAGDGQAVIDTLSRAGIPRSSYWYWSAHYAGLHICGPASCGYPQADATQYAAGQYYDSDVFSAYMFGPVTDPSFPLKQGDADVTSKGPVRQLQNRLNVWETVIGKYKTIPVDGQYGPVTKLAVAFAQTHFAQRGVEAGICNKELFLLLSNSPVPVKPPPPPKPPVKPDAPLQVGVHVKTTYTLRITRAIAGYRGEYATKVEDAHGHVVYDGRSHDVAFDIPLPAAGDYTVTTGAAGYDNTVKNVHVPS